MDIDAAERRGTRGVAQWLNFSSEFQTDRGVNVPKFRSFELFRRHTWRPEIITFDELLHRARFIVGNGAEENLGRRDEDNRR